MKNNLSVSNVLHEGKSAGCLVGGMIAGNVILKMDKKGGMLFPIALTGGGIAGAAFFRNTYLKLLALGISAFGAIKLLNTVAAVETTETTNGLLGFKLPEGVRSALVKYVPQLGEVGENIDYSKLAGDLDLPELAPGYMSGDMMLPEGGTQGLFGLGQSDIQRMVA